MIFTAIPVFMPFFIFGIVLLAAKATKKPARDISSGMKQFFFAYAVVMGYLYFFQEKEILFVCDHRTLQCTYEHATIFRPELRYVASYDLNGVGRIFIKTEKRYRRHSTDEVYKLVFMSDAGEKEFPKTFDFIEDARDERLRLNRFLKERRRRYAYHHGQAGLGDFEKGIKYSFFVTLATLVRLFLRDRLPKRKIKEI